MATKKVAKKSPAAKKPKMVQMELDDHIDPEEFEHLIQEAGYIVDKFALMVKAAEEKKKAAASEFKIAETRYRSAVNDLVKLSRGQKVVPSTEGRLGEPQLDSDAGKWPLSQLGQKEIKAVVGDEEFEAAKKRDEPLGLTPAQIQKFADVKLVTIADLEARMVELPKEWFFPVSNTIDSKVAQRVIATIGAVRRKHPAA